MSRAKMEIEIEAMLHWAYARQCVDRVASARFTPRGPSGSTNGAAVQMLELGCRVDNATHAEKILGAKTPDDAMVLHDAVLALEDMWLDDEAGLWTRERAARAGLAIERKNGRWWLCADAQAAPLHCAHVPALIVIHAKAGTRPECFAGWKAPRGRPAKDGAALTEGNVEAISAAGVAMARAEYAVWCAALVFLAASLADAFEQHAPLPPVAPAAPWLIESQGQNWLIPDKSNDDKPLKTRAKKRI